MTASDSLLVEYPSDAIVVFRLNRPQVRNALNLEVRARLADEVTRHADDPAVRCLIITGSDTVFAAGADIGQMAEAGPIEIMARHLQKYWRTIMDCPKPVIANAFFMPRHLLSTPLPEHDPKPQPTPKS